VNVTFVGNATDPERDPLTWLWSWDDGNSTRFSTASGVSQTIVDYAWADPGTYNVTVTVDDTLCGSLKTSGLFRVVVAPLPSQYGWVNGTVRDAATLAPIAGASVRTTPGGYGDTTNATGRYSILLPSGTYSVRASHVFYVPETRASVIVATNATMGVDFALVRARGWIVGTVTSSGGGPVETATVRASGGGREFVNQTDAQGRYNVTVAPGTYAVEASHSAYFPQNVTGVAVADGQERLVDFVLVPLVSPGIDPLTAGLIALAVVIIIGAVAAWLVVRRRKKEEIPAPPPPPPVSPPSGPGPR